MDLILALECGPDRTHRPGTPSAYSMWPLPMMATISGWHHAPVIAGDRIVALNRRVQLARP